jgi:hypothetical protein
LFMRKGFTNTQRQARRSSKDRNENWDETTQDPQWQKKGQSVLIHRAEIKALLSAPKKKSFPLIPAIVFICSGTTPSFSNLVKESACVCVC